MGVDTEWHEWRRHGIGGSDIAALLGLSRYASPLSLWADKAGLTEPDPTTDRQRIGQVMEHALGVLFHERTGLHIIGEQTWCHHRDDARWRCTTDGFAAESADSSIDDALGVVQHKTDGRFGWPDGPPVNIRAQCIWEMGVTGLTHCWLSVMFAGWRYEVFELDWSDPDVRADWDLMVATADKFWTDHVATGVMPAADGSDATTDALAWLHRDPEPDTSIEADDALVALVQEYDAVGRHIAADKKRREAIGNAIRQAIGDRTDVTLGVNDRGHPNVIASWRPQEQTRINAEAVRAAHGTRFDTTSTIRVLRSHLPKTTTPKGPPK